MGLVFRPSARRDLFQGIKGKLADRVGFEPTVTLLLHTLSKRAHSTTLTPVRIKLPVWSRRAEAIPANTDWQHRNHTYSCLSVLFIFSLFLTGGIVPGENLFGLHDFKNRLKTLNIRFIRIAEILVRLEDVFLIAS